VIGAAVALPVVLALAGAMRWLGPRIGALDHPDATLKPHAHPVSFLGGLAVAGGLAAGLLVGAAPADLWPFSAWVTVAVFSPAAVGLLDDAVGLRPAFRLGSQIVLAVLLVTAGNLEATALPGQVLAMGGAALLYVAAMNAVNMADGMDGLAGGLGVLSGIGIALVAIAVDRSGAVPMILAAATLGFLVHNLPPARLFLGDNGAYLVGAGLVVAALRAGRTVPALAGAASCLGLFLLDLLLAVLRRAAGRAPLFSGDRGHLYDQLQARGRPVGTVLSVAFAAHAALAAVGVVASGLETGPALALVGGAWAVAVAALFVFGFVTARAPR
jgi:UDP-GlcNAc:undecaprenyl-phosphate/decaprenyl-phosphate GlcNAc-1-phosphate transferase